jgi:RNA polymerase sigma-70 factor (ECF subfamily)
MRGDRVGSAEDIRLVRDVATGSQDALAALYDRHAEAVFVVACRLTDDRQLAEEVVQETFLALWNRAELFDPNAGSLSAWLHTIARNRTIDRLRAIGRRPRLVPVSSIRQNDEADASALERIAGAGVVVGGADLGPGPEGALDALDVRLAIRHVLDDLPEVERAVILLAYRDDLTQAEIAQRLGWPIGTVKTRTRRALLRLREALGSSLGPERAVTMVGAFAGRGEKAP